jgi:hypothetical protein
VLEIKFTSNKCEGGVIIQILLTYNMICPTRCLTAPSLNTKYENKACLVVWVDLNTELNILVTMAEQGLVACLLPGSKGIWKYGSRHKFNRRFHVGTSSKIQHLFFCGSVFLIWPE